VPDSPGPSYPLVHRPRRPKYQPSTDDSDADGSDSYTSLSDFEGFSLVHRPKPATTNAMMQDVFEDTETGWLGINAPADNRKSSMYLQSGLADSNATIKPLVDSAAATEMETDDLYSSDSDWSVVDKPTTKTTAFV